MAKGKNATKTVDKWKKKKWFKVFASKEFNEAPLGETPTTDPANLMGRTLKTSLMNLTGSMQKQNINMTFEVIDVKGESAYTSVKQYALVPSSIKRKVRRQKDKLDLSFVCLTKDDILVRIKPMLITNSKTTSQVKTALTKATFANVLTLVRALEYKTLVSDVVNYKFQRALRNTLNKIYPLKLAEVRVLDRLKEDLKKQSSLAERIKQIVPKKEVHKKKPFEKKPEFKATEEKPVEEKKEDK